jgi:lipooligosaccharide transport system permease protein
VRPLTFGELPENIVLHIAVLAAYAVVGFYVAMVLFRRRLLG